MYSYLQGVVHLISICTCHAGFNFLAFAAFSVFITLLKDSLYYTETILAILNLPY